jgi:hypothetical protein
LLLAIGLGMKAGEETVERYLSTEQKSVNGWKISSLFGDRDFFEGDWLLRAAGAKAGIYGNDSVEATYPMTRVDADRGLDLARPSAQRRALGWRLRDHFVCHVVNLRLYRQS